MAKEIGHIELLKFAIPLVMLLVGINQVWLANSNTLTAWKGGGFGMFSNSISVTERVLVCKGFDGRGKEYHLDGNLDYFNQGQWPKDYKNKIRSFPKLNDLRSIAETMLDYNYVERLNFEKHSAGLQLGWEIKESLFEPVKSKDFKLKDETTVQFSSIIVCIYELRYNAEDNSVKYHELLKYRADR